MEVALLLQARRPPLRPRLSRLRSLCQWQSSPLQVQFLSYLSIPSRLCLSCCPRPPWLLLAPATCACPYPLAKLYHRCSTRSPTIGAAQPTCFAASPCQVASRLVSPQPLPAGSCPCSQGGAHPSGSPCQVASRLVSPQPLPAGSCPCSQGGAHPSGRPRPQRGAAAPAGPAERCGQAPKAGAAAGHSCQQPRSISPHARCLSWSSQCCAAGPADRCGQASKAGATAGRSCQQQPQRASCFGWSSRSRDAASSP